MKRIVFCIFLLTVYITEINAQADFYKGEFCFRPISQDCVAFTNLNYNGKTPPSEVSIPSEVVNDGKKYKVTQILGFSGGLELKSGTTIKIPSSIVSIKNVFVNNLKLIVDPQNKNYKVVDGILFNMFETELVSFPIERGGTYQIPQTVKTICHSAFSNSKLSSIIIPNSVNTIEGFAFLNTQFESVVIPGSVKTIGAECFWGSRLTHVDIPASVDSIGLDAFARCNTLQNINVHPDNKKYASVNGILYNKEITGLIQCPNGKKGSIIMPNTVHFIGNGAFRNCEGITAVTFSKQLKIIGRSAFLKCNGLRKIYLPDSLVIIGQEAFAGCTELFSVSLPEATRYQAFVFGKCNKLQILSIRMSNGTVKNISAASLK